MSYTNKKVVWEKCVSKSSGDSVAIDPEALNVLDEYGDSIENMYGDVSRLIQCEIKARKQPHETVLRTADGKELLTKSYFYVDPKIEPNALSISKMDKLDGEIVMEKYVMCDLSNKPKMVRYITV